MDLYRSVEGPACNPVMDLYSQWNVLLTALSWTCIASKGSCLQSCHGHVQTSGRCHSQRLLEPVLTREGPAHIPVTDLYRQVEGPTHNSVMDLYRPGKGPALSSAMENRPLPDSQN